MLTEPRPHSPLRRQHSLRQEYEEFLLQRIEEFKEQLSREELLAIADEAVRELEVGSEEQLVLTEVLVLEHVDRLIMRRLKLPPFRRWRERYVRLRRAQREPTHWGLEPDAPLVGLAQQIAGDGTALVVGRRCAPAAFFLAAHDWPVVFLDQELAVVEATEAQAATEALGNRIQGLVVRLGDWFPELEPVLSVVDAATLGALEASARSRFLDDLKRRTPRGGIHCLAPAHRSETAIRFAPEAFKAHYQNWRIERARTARGRRWLLATKY